MQHHLPNTHFAIHNMQHAKLFSTGVA